MNCMTNDKTLSNTKILSWNIQSSNTLTGSKFTDSEFCATFSNHHILCLQENRQRVKLPGFRAFNNTHNDEKHGGVCILVRNEISSGISLIKTSAPDIVVCKLKHTYFNTAKDIFIVNAYIKPDNTSCKTSNYTGSDTLHEIDLIVNDLQSRGEIIVCGDFNARVSVDPDFLIDDTPMCNDFIPLPDDYIPDNLYKRNSQDLRSNSYKRPFLDFLKNNSIHILNGRTLGDFTGKFTCVEKTGSSVVDYFITSPQVRLLVNHFTVKPFTQFSDHKPLSLSIKLNSSSIKHQPLSGMFEKAPVRYKFSANNKESYTAIQDDCEMLGIVNNIKTTPYDNTPDGTYKLNSDFTTYLQTIADKTLTKTKHVSQDKTNKNPWFNNKCREGKRLTNKAARLLSDFPDSDYLRQNYYKVKKQYKAILKSNKSSYFDQLNADIEDGKILNWKQFKRLKKRKSNSPQFDSVDMSNFQKFFNDLYSNNHTTISQDQKQSFIQEADATNLRSCNINSSTSDSENYSLNSEISHGEIRASVKSLKCGKSSSSDLICNELLINLKDNGIDILHKLYNMCLVTGTYPWNNSIISPLHKKGCKDNPDNYRAVAVSSTIGKLFSTILLDRLINYRNSKCPDPPNQLGFTKGAQTYDHVLTLNTITSKYRKLRKKVYAVFVDFRKAFDLVCREALFLKLSRLGITGKFYDVLRHMYSNSTAQIKLSNHICNKFKINKGTEQGHPLSPDLFKIFLSDLSPLLESSNCPELMDKIVSHLLWADDLVLLALDPKTLQSQLNSLHSFCTQWGIDINIDKTKCMTFNNRGKETHTFYLGTNTLKHVDTYTYLGFNIHKSGSLSHARTSLRFKAMRALYGMKGTINKTKLSHRSLCTLFDALVKPVVLYGAPIWCPSMPAIKYISNILSTLENTDLQNTSKSILGKLSVLDCEKVHLHFLKWSLGVHQRSSNVGSWGETGRYPLAYECIKLTLNYMQRLRKLSSNCNNSLVCLAYKEQQKSKLEWYSRMEPLLRLDSTYATDHVTVYKNCLRSEPDNPSPSQPDNTLIFNNKIKHISVDQTILPMISRHFTPHIIIKSLKTQFKQLWNKSKEKSPKLEFYHKHKSDFVREHYLDCVKNFYDRASLTKFRISAHDLLIESGRYKNIVRENRHCTWCKLSIGLEIVETEDHALYICDLYTSIRQQHKQIIANMTGTPTTEIDFMSLLQSASSRTTTNTNNVVQYHQVQADPCPETSSNVIHEIARVTARILKHREISLRQYKASQNTAPKSRKPTVANTLAVTV